MGKEIDCPKSQRNDLDNNSVDEQQKQILGDLMENMENVAYVDYAVLTTTLADDQEHVQRSVFLEMYRQSIEEEILSVLEVRHAEIVLAFMQLAQEQYTSAVATADILLNDERNKNR